MYKKTVSFFLWSSLLLLLPSPSAATVVSDGETTLRSTIEQDYNARRRALPGDSAFSILSSSLQEKEKLYLQFLYAYMPLPDLADYPGRYYKDNVDCSITAQQEMSWGRTVPEREFLHFVLPVRVNNERLDDSRRVFYGQLKDRVRHLSMYNAILEVNHWCHERVVYRPSDARTSSPLASVRTAYGRCGEESTFLVAALRSVGIPARQVYTPRWAHTDDNHAWVEAWADGKWYFLGACEPEPVLNLGWFNESASRGMLMHTKVFGKYSGPEEVMSRTPCYTEINVIQNYAPCSPITIHVRDSRGRSVAGARVEFKLYNYAEFYTVATRTTDAQGNTTLTAGRGDMIVWVSKGGIYSFRKVRFGQDTQCDITLVRPRSSRYSLDMDIVPPAASATLPTVTPEQRALNTRRMLLEDSIRGAYVATFPTESRIKAFAAECHLDEAVVSSLLTASRGNYAVLMTFLREAEDKMRAVRLLQTLSQKDLRDVPSEVLRDNMTDTTVDVSSPLFLRYVLCPRVADEWLTPYKHFLRQAISTTSADSWRKDPRLLVRWCTAHIRIDHSWNPQSLVMSPESVYRLRLTDAASRDVFFVAIARSMGIPAQVNPVNEKVEYYAGGDWHDVDFERSAALASSKGQLSLDFVKGQHNDNPKYYYHFTLSEIQDGRLHLQGYPEGSSWQDTYSHPLSLYAGRYLMVSGTRMADGSVLAHLEFFPITRGATTKARLIMRESQDQLQVIGSFNSEDLYSDEKTGKDKSLLSTTGRGYYIIGIVGPGQEPTNHTLRDIAAYSQEFQSWGRPIVLLCDSKDDLSRFNRTEFSGLPSTVVWGADINGQIKKEILSSMKLTSSSLPIFLVADTFNRVVYMVQGYTIGLGEQLMKVIKKL